jgi:hypothetical protein
MVYSTALVPPTIMLSCECGAEGRVTNFKLYEWSAAFYAPSGPYKWTGENKRVKLVKS